MSNPTYCRQFPRVDPGPSNLFHIVQTQPLILGERWFSRCRLDLLVPDSFTSPNWTPDPLCPVCAGSKNQEPVKINCPQSGPTALPSLSLPDVREKIARFGGSL
jgi:hypothetical protein